MKRYGALAVQWSFWGISEIEPHLMAKRTRASQGPERPAREALHTWPRQGHMR